MSILKVNTIQDKGGNNLLVSDGAGTISSGGAITNTPAFSVQLANSQTLTNNTTSVILFDTINHDTDSAYNSSTGEFTVPTGKAGKYYFCGHIRTGTTTDFGRFAAIIQVNGSTKASVNNVNRDEDSSTASLVIDLSVGDQVRFAAFQNSGGDLSTKTADNMMFMGFKLIGA